MINTNNVSNANTNLEKENEILKNKIEALIKDKERTSKIMGKLNTALEKQKHLDKMKTEFLSVTSHELKTPLTPIKAQLEMIEVGMLGKINEKQKKGIAMILRNVIILNDLIGDILDISKLESNNMKFSMVKTDINSTIKDVVEMMKPNTKKKEMNLEFHSDKEHLLVEHDPRRLSQVIVNVISNAIKFTDKKGSILVQVSHNVPGVTIKISDNGIGIPENALERIFAPFEQVDSSRSRNFEGTGLGLAICKGIILRHDGNICAQSEEGKGAIFIINLPYNQTNKRKEDEMDIFFSEPNN